MSSQALRLLLRETPVSQRLWGRSLCSVRNLKGISAAEGETEAHRGGSQHRAGQEPKSGVVSSVGLLPPPPVTWRPRTSLKEQRPQPTAVGPTLPVEDKSPGVAPSPAHELG